MVEPEEAYLGLPWSWQLIWDHDEQCFVMTIDELPDFFAAGKTAAEAAINAREAFLSHITGYLATGTPIPVPQRSTQDRSHTATMQGSALECAV